MKSSEGPLEFELKNFLLGMDRTEPLGTRRVRTGYEPFMTEGPFLQVRS